MMLGAHLRFACRGLAREPGWSLVAVGTLALGFGATIAIWSVVRAVLVEPLPYHRPDRLVAVWERLPDGRLFRAAPANYFDWRTSAGTFDDLAAFAATGAHLTGDGEPEQVLGAAVSASYFSVLGVAPQLGRAFAAGEDEPGADGVVVLGHGLWQRRYAGRADIVGQHVLLDERPHLVIGVMPSALFPTWPETIGRIGFRPELAQYWKPLALAPARRSARSSHVLGVIGRLHDGASLPQARAEMDAIARRLAVQYPETNQGEGIAIVSLREAAVGAVRPATLVLAAAAALLLLAACANAGGLILARGLARSRELSTRSALGATRWQLVVQQVCESVVLSVLGGVLGVGFARVTVGLFVHWLPTYVPRLAEAAVDLPIAGLALASAVAVGVGVGLVPALLVAQLRPAGALRSAPSVGAATPRQRLRSVLVVVEIAAAVVLVAGAGLLARSFANLLQVDPGFASRRVLVVDLAVPGSRHADMGALIGFYRAARERVAGMAGVRGVALAYDHALEASWIDSFTVVGERLREQDRSADATMRPVSPGYFATMQVPLLRGREFAEWDDQLHPGVVVVNEAFARRYFPGEEAIGRELLLTTPARLWGEGAKPRYRIVGVAGNERFMGVDADPAPAFYLCSEQVPNREMSLLVATEADPLSLLGAVKRQLAELDPNLPLGRVDTMAAALGRQMAPRRFAMALVGGFGSVALVLAALGVYGLLAHAVARRTPEIGLRMALGASAHDLMVLVVKPSLLLVAAGLAIGVGAALLGGRFVTGLLFGVPAHDPATFGATIALLLLAGALASYLPARRAVRVDPLRALRHD